MTKQSMTFAEWQATRNIMLPQEASDHLGIDVEMFTGASRVYVYDDSLYLLEDDNGETFSTHIERDEWMGSLRKIENILFLEWYVSECAKWDQNVACDWLNTWCTFYDVEPHSADEILHDLLTVEPSARTLYQRRQITWLEWFIGQWEERE